MYFLLPIVLLLISLIPLIFMFKIKDSDIPVMSEEIENRGSGDLVAKSRAD